MIEVEFHGAAKTVTGSNFLVKLPDYHFVVDCGMFQGPDVESRNLIPYEYDASKVDFVFLTHAHIDHCGMLPKLYREGFRGKIYATRETREIAELLLLDSAKIQENNYQEGKFYGKYTEKVAMVYDSYDAEKTIELFETIEFDESFSPVEGLKAKYIRAGHILGAASIEVEIEHENQVRNLLFSGDIGRVDQPLIPTFDLQYQSEPDYIFIESLYGGTTHPNRQDSVDDLIEIIKETLKKGGNVYIPTFSVQRTQEVLHMLKIAQEKGKIDEDQPVWLDSPLAQKVSKIYTAALQDTADSLFYFNSLRFIKKYSQSKKLFKSSGQIILAGSGMADGGRIMGHLTAALDKRKHSVVFVGYQAVGTLGRELVDGHKEVNINETKLYVRAGIHCLHGFSAHGDNNDYLSWIQRHQSDKLKKVFLIHAEEDRARALDLELDKIGVMESHIPDWKESITLD